MYIKKFAKYILFLIGISIIIYPFAIKIISYNNQTIAIVNYNNMVDELSDKEKEEQKNQIIEYNQKIYDNKNSTNYIDLFNIGDILGYISIPKLDINIPIYEGTTDKVLSKGVGHLEKTSLPIGGKSTHAVLVGHTGLTKSKIFDDLEQLKIEDEFCITYLGENLYYKIYDIRIVLPEETEFLKIQKDQDLVTLVTCTPRYINTHRILVTGKRIYT